MDGDESEPVTGLSCLMIALKNKHKTKDVSRELGKALHCTWEETTLRFSGVLLS